MTAKKFPQDLESLRRLVDNLPGMVFRVRNDRNWTSEFISRGSREMIGLASTACLHPPNNRYQDRVHPDDQARAREVVDKALAAGETFQVAYRLKTASGNYKWVYEQGRGVFAADGRLEAIEGIVTDFTRQQRTEEELRREIQTLRARLPRRTHLGALVGHSDAMQAVYEFIRKAAASEANVIIYGESGTGKELVAREIHARSRRRDARLVAVNCGAIPETMWEAEFFGHRRGAFTGAVSDRQGYLEAAHGGTLFLDELGEIRPAMQVKLLRLLETKEYTPIGANLPRRADVRIIAATGRDLAGQVRSGEIREDFFYRIHVLTVQLPALRERPEDIPLLLDHFTRRLISSDAAAVFAEAEIQALQQHAWPGNVRELQNAVERFVAMGELGFARGGRPDRDAPGGPAEAGGPNLHRMVANLERRVIVEALQRHRWNRSRVAAALGIDRKTLYNKIRQYGLMGDEEG